MMIPNQETYAEPRASSMTPLLIRQSSSMKVDGFSDINVGRPYETFDHTRINQS